MKSHVVLRRTFSSPPSLHLFGHAHCCLCAHIALYAAPAILSSPLLKSVGHAHSPTSDACALNVAGDILFSPCLSWLGTHIHLLAKTTYKQAHLLGMPLPPDHYYRDVGDSEEELEGARQIARHSRLIMRLVSIACVCALAIRRDVGGRKGMRTCCGLSFCPSSSASFIFQQRRGHQLTPLPLQTNDWHTAEQRAVLLLAATHSVQRLLRVPGHGQRNRADRQAGVHSQVPPPYYTI